MLSESQPTFQTSLELIPLIEIIRSLKQTATTCVLKLSPEVVGFIVTGPEVGPEGVQIWS